MYKQILCPIDGSATSDCGMTEALKLAKDQKAKIHFLHVVDNYFPVMGATGELNYVGITDILREHGKKILRKAEESAELAGVSADTEMVIITGGEVYKCILDQINQCKADLIVMGTHGLRGFERLVMGSDAEAIVRTSPVPVLLVRNNPD